MVCGKWKRFTNMNQTDIYNRQRIGLFLLLEGGVGVVYINCNIID